jgi:carbon storage regulator
MLVLSRRKNQSMILSGGIKITIVRTGTDNVRIGIEAPTNVIVLREELADGTWQRRPQVPVATETGLVGTAAPERLGGKDGEADAAVADAHDLGLDPIAAIDR